MSLYILLYLLVVILLQYVGVIFYKKYKNIGGLGLLLFNFFISCWLALYFLTYFGSTNLGTLLNISRLTYASSLLAFYSLLLFIIYFDNTSKKIKINIYSKLMIIFILSFGLLTVFSPLVIESMYLNVEKNDYYEKSGVLFNLYLYLEILFIPMFIFFIFRKYKSLYYINKIRLKYIIIGLILFILLGITFQLVLPIYGIYILEKEAVLFLLPFLLLTWYSITRYHFTDLTFRYKDFYSFILSTLCTILILVFIKEFSLSLSKNFIEYWGIHKDFTYIDILIGIIIYIFFYKIFFRILPGNSEYENLINILNSWKEKIPFISNLNDLNNYLTKESKRKFAVNIFRLKLIDNNNDNELYKFFNKNYKNDIFINDVVFIEENNYNFNNSNINKIIDNGVYIVFPIFASKKQLIGLLEIGRKPFNENFYTEEIRIIKDFVKFLVGHIKYMEIYAEINYLNLNLDKEVDRKTMEYNNLINKQKEFISMASHEIKTPVTASYMQIESIMEDVIAREYNQTYLEEELNILKEQIYKVVDLVKNIFTVQQYEIKDIGLYIEKVKFKNLIIGEYDILSRLYPDIDFQINISDSVGFVEIDKIQFIQVISNLLNNSVKFLNNTNPIIKINAKSVGELLEIVIEDNGPGFNHGDENVIFEKYSTGKGKSVGIGMGLYLCKKIVELHLGTIVAEKSIDLGGAKFKIIIPKNYNKLTKNGLIY